MIGKQWRQQNREQRGWDGKKQLWMKFVLGNLHRLLNRPVRPVCSKGLGLHGGAMWYFPHIHFIHLLLGINADTLSYNRGSKGKAQLFYTIISYIDIFWYPRPMVGKIFRFRASFLTSGFLLCGFYMRATNCCQGKKLSWWSADSARAKQYVIQSAIVNKHFFPLSDLPCCFLFVCLLLLLLCFWFFLRCCLFVLFCLFNQKKKKASKHRFWLSCSVS